MVNFRSFIFIVFASLFTHYSYAQVKDYSFGEGLQYTAKDSTFGIKASLRFQSLFMANWNVHNDNLNDIGNLESNFLIRRARLKFDGFAYSPKLSYKVELGLSNRDLDHEGAKYYGEGGNLILDAYLKWNFYKGFSLKVGQFKLPGNRERLVSSEDMQFVDRSILNSRFTLDRDIGASLHYDKVLGKQFGLHLSAAFSQGEGRNITSGNIGDHQTTFKIELMPFGKFTKKGAYVGGDVYREQKPKLAVAVAFDRNAGAGRARGNKGAFFPGGIVLQDLYTGFADFMFKYKGFSMMGEYVIRQTSSNSPMLVDQNGGFTPFQYFTGTAVNLQAGYVFKNNFELAARYSHLGPESFSMADISNHYTLGASKYIKGHSLKVQTDLGYIQNQLLDDGLTWRVQIEVGF